MTGYSEKLLPSACFLIPNIMEILNQFGIKPVLLAAQVVNFLILLYILKRFLYGPILKVLKERKDKIVQSLKTAEEIEKKLVAISEEEQKRIVQAASEAEKIIKQAQDSAVSIIDEGRIKAEDVAEKIMADTRVQMQQEKEKLQNEVKANLATFVILAFQKVTGKVIEKDQKELIEKTLKELK